MDAAMIISDSTDDIMFDRWFSISVPILFYKHMVTILNEF